MPVKLVEICVRREVAIFQAARGGIWMASLHGPAGLRGWLRHRAPLGQASANEGASRYTARLLTRDPATLSRADHQFVEAVHEVTPVIREVANLITEFGRLLRRQSDQPLTAWLKAASATTLHHFSRGLANDLDALQAAAREPLSNGSAEGLIQSSEADEAANVRVYELRSASSACPVLLPLGSATPLLLLACGSRSLVARRRERLAAFSAKAKPLMGGALVLIGAFVITGLDEAIESAVTTALPDWRVGLTTSV